MRTARVAGKFLGAGVGVFAVMTAGRDRVGLILIVALLVATLTAATRAYRGWRGPLSIAIVMALGITALLLTLRPYGGYTKGVVGCSPGCGYSATIMSCPSVLRSLPTKGWDEGLLDTGPCVADRLSRQVLLVPEVGAVTLGVALIVGIRRRRGARTAVSHVAL